MKRTRGRTPTTMLLAAVSAAAATAILAACGPTTDAAGSEAGAPDAPVVTNAPAATDPAATDPVATNTVAIENFAYSPATITVKAGTTVTWTNKDQDPHTVTAMNNGPFHSPPMNTGDTFTYTFTAPGRFEYVCTIHPFMTATVVVTP